MFGNLLWFEIKNRLCRISALIYFTIYFALSFLVAITFAGTFKGASLDFGLSNKLALNSPIVLNFLTCFMGYFGLLITAPIFGQSISQDYETRFQEILFSTALKKSHYFFSRYFASFISVLFILTSIGLGLWFASQMSFVNKTLISKNHCWFYLAPYLSNIIPDILIFGAIFITVASISKKMASVYVATIAIIVGYLIAYNITGDIENKLVAALIEPFGFESAFQVTRYWSLVEQSTKVVPITGNFLYNRLLWGFIGTSFLVFAYIVFNPFTLPKDKKKKIVNESLNNLFNLTGLYDTAYSLRINSWRVYLNLSFSEFKQAFSNLYFLLILLWGIIFIFAISGQVGKIYGTQTFPVTYLLLEGIGNPFELFIMILTIYYAGELIWRDRDHNTYELIESKPISNFYLFLSKFLSLVLIQIFLLFIVIICCVLIQIFNGYFTFELGLYFQSLFFYSLIPLLLLNVFVLFVQTLVPNKHIGHSVVVLYFVILILLRSLGFNHHLYLMGKIPREIYSDMNKYGNLFWSFITYSFYWGFFYLSLATLTVLFWRRGSILTWKDRIIEFKRRIKFIHKILFGISLFGWVSLGVFIYYNTNILNIYKTRAENEKESVDYELKYKQFEHLKQPDLEGAKIWVNLFPEKRSMNAEGHFTYKNNSNQPIKTLFLNSDPPHVISLIWNKPVTIKESNHKLGVQIYNLSEPLKPNETIELKFKINVESKGFTNSGSPIEIVENGTFFYNYDFFPVMGYSTSLELSNDKIRRKYGLREKDRVPTIDEKEAATKTYLSQEGTWINFEATISTAKDQIAIAPGYLEKQWEQNGRRFFHYKMNQPILNYYAFLSARYEVQRDHWNDVKIEVYHHPAHAFNTARMITAIKKSLDYYTQNFSPYQFKLIRIVEFPRYSMFAQSFPNTIPYSEGVGFIACINKNDPESIDYPFYVTAHEVAHQWWAHQVIGANVQGASMLSESLAQYSALMVQEREYGPVQMRKFLKYELDKYLSGRMTETKKELPLMFNENQTYIHYNKGSLVFYALKDYLGEKVVNEVLRNYIRDVAFQKPPFTRSTDLVQRFKDAAPKDKKYLVEDLFETITFYDNRTETVTFKKNAFDKYEVKIETVNKKMRVNGEGRESQVAMNDYIDIGIFDDKDLIYLKKHKVKSGKNIFHIIIDRKPTSAGIDPFNKLIDKISDNKIVKAVEIKE